MKIPLLILCLTVVYGTCRTYDEEDDVTKAIQNNGDYKNYVNMPFERSLARYKRTILPSVISPLSLLSLLGLNDVGSTNENFMISFINELLTGKDVWSTINKLSSAIFSKLPNPFMAIIQTVVNLTNKIIGVSFDKIFQVTKVFILQILLPALHTFLNKLPTKLLPTQVVGMIDAFNALYLLLKLTGNVP